MARGWAALLLLGIPSTARAAEWFVATNGSDAAAGTNWATAKQTIQAAIDAATNGSTVWVSNGVYATGGVTNSAVSGTNRVAIRKPITVQSVNGPEETIIQGAWDPVWANGLAAVRCVYVGTNAVLSGFTLTNGAGGAGGGAWCEISGVMSNCVLSGNSAGGEGGGSYGGKLYRCRLIENNAVAGGGGARGTLVGCTLIGNSAQAGGGTFYTELTDCTLTGNSATIDGGGAYISTLRNCLLTGNSAGNLGGGAYGSKLTNCTVTGNSAEGESGGLFMGNALNSIVYYNAAPLNPNSSAFITNSCTTPIPSWDAGNNITNDPQFVDAGAGNYRLQAISPCIDAGDNAFVQGTTDMDGNPRIAYGTVDMGAYEAQFPVGYWAWAAAITNGLTNETDCAVGDGMPNLLRYAAGGHPMEADGLARLDVAFESGLPTLVFNRNPNATDVTLLIEGADEMSDEAIWRGLATNRNGSWGGAANVSESGQGNPVACAVQDPVPLITNRFLRLKVTRP